MPRTSKIRRKKTPLTDPATVAGPPTQSQGIREAQENPDPADPTKKVHPDSVPLRGVVQPSRFDAVMPTAEPVQPDEQKDERSEDDQDGTRATNGNPNR